MGREGGDDDRGRYPHGGSVVSRDPISQARRDAYAAGRFLGDVQAVRKGKVGQRIVRKAVYRTGIKGIARLLKGLR